MQAKEAVRGRELELSIADDMRRRAASASGPEPEAVSASGAAFGSLSPGVFEEWLRAAQEGARAIGRMPPSSGTLRSRIGALLVRIVRRMLFWYTPQIAVFNTAILTVAQEQNKLIQRLSAELSLLKTNFHDFTKQAHAEQVNEQVKSDQLAEEIAALDARVGAIPPAVERNDQELLGYIRSEQTNREQRFAVQEAQLLQLRTMLFAQERRLTVPVPGASVPASTASAAPELDNLYLMLEDHLRGTREDIAARVRMYVPFLKDAGSGTAEMPVLDLGCGRGEWLEVLREHGLAASGVDLNFTFVSYCQQLGMDVTLGDAIENLRGRSDASLGAVTGFHIVEHLPWSTLVELIDEIVRVLKPGGLVIFETPNPDNVLVGSRNFYLDPTHCHPLPSQLLQFLIQARGLSRVDVLPLHPYPEASRVPGEGAITARFNDCFYGPQDYAVIGRKV